MIDISIIVVSYNTKHLLEDCLKSTVLASKNLDTEIFVVDNASHDGTVQMVKKEFPEVLLIANSNNGGFSKANNQAIKKAKGEYLLILNPDTKLQKDTLTKMKSFMDRRSDVAVSTCRVELPDGTLDRDCRRSFPTPWRAFCHFTNLEKIFAKSKTFDQYYMGYLSEGIEHEIDSCVGAFMMVKKTAVEKIGLFDEDFFFYGEDLDWCFRFNEAGYKIVYTPITKIIHYKGASSGIKKHSHHLSRATVESKKRALVESTNAMVTFYKKHYKQKYNPLISGIVIGTILVIEKIRLFKLSHI